jgi:hypothetical protein
VDKPGELKLVNPRTVWAHEAADFTPWLALEENIGKLADALDMELEVENTEVAVGPYSADILARDAFTGRYVVIENQLGKTDHDHLGKMITYAAALDASRLVLIATEFSEEHQKAFEWLNEHTTEDLGFYGVRLEVWRIDASRSSFRTAASTTPTTARRSQSCRARQIRSHHRTSCDGTTTTSFWNRPYLSSSGVPL